MTQVSTKEVCRTSSVRVAHLKACTASADLAREHVGPLHRVRANVASSVSLGLQAGCLRQPTLAQSYATVSEDVLLPLCRLSYGSTLHRLGVKSPCERCVRSLRLGGPNAARRLEHSFRLVCQRCCRFFSSILYSSREKVCIRRTVLVFER